MGRLRIVCASLGPLALLACGSSLSGSPDAATDGPADGRILVEASEPDANRDGRSPTDAGADAPSDGRVEDGPRDGSRRDRDMTEDAADAGPDDASDAGEPEDVTEPDAGTCLPQTPDSSTGLFVTVGGSTSTSCGTLSKPCATVGLALQIAGSTPGITTVYVGPGPFVDTKTVALANGVQIVGGWFVKGTKWTHSCIPPEIRGPSPVLSATGLASATTLDTLDVMEVDPASTPGGSVYGITSFDSNLTLIDVSVHVEPGGAGADGPTPGDAGAPGAAGGCSGASTGAPGSAGEAGAPTTLGIFHPPPVGYVTLSNGDPGSPGGPGAVGTKGGPGGTVTGVVGCVGSACEETPKTYPVPDGLPGCAGGGGAGGEPGTPGGCSVGVYAWGGSVAIAGGTLQTGAGGPGGSGTLGGSGGTGAKGVAGSSIEYVSGCVEATSCKNLLSRADGGAAGGPGGSGGVGGRGGGGAGGCSFAYFLGGDAGVASDAAIVTGGGGPGGAPNGLTGAAGEHN